MTISLQQGRVVMSSQISDTIINIHPLAHILDTCALMFSSCALFYSLFHPNQVTATHPSPVDNHQSTRGRSERTESQAKMAVTHVTNEPGLSTLSDLSRIGAQPPLSFLCWPRPSSHHPSSLTSVSVPAHHLLPPSTPF